MNRASNNIFIGIVGAIVLVLLGALGYFVGNYVGTPRLAAPAVIEGIHYQPAYTTYSGSGDHRSSTHHSAYWKIMVRLDAGRDIFRKAWMPPVWMQEGSIVRATYQVGRWNHRVHVIRLDPLP
jgi:hypothetical protein